MSKTFNIYCDESCHIENDHKPYMFLGSMISSYNQLKLHNKCIKEIKAKHNFRAEIKWTSVSKSKLHFYIDLVDFFFGTEDLKFSCVGIAKAQINSRKNEQSYDDFIIKLYELLLSRNIDTSYSYNVYLDFQDSLSVFKKRKINAILINKYGNGVFNNVQNICSKESSILQLTDFIMGAISYQNNNKEKLNLSKLAIIERIQNFFKDDLMATNTSDKLNLFFAELT